MPSGSHPDALGMKRERGAEGGDQTLFKHHGDLSMTKVRRSLGEKSNIKDEEEKEGPSQQEIPGDFVRRPKEAFLMGP